MAGWAADYADPDSFLRVGLQARYTGWSHTEYDELIGQAARTLDAARRLDLYRSADAILMRELPIVPIGYVRKDALVKPWVKVRSWQLVVPLNDVVIYPH
jgi:ABC-type oligopeptide transport system substrate-binding subunit